MKDSQALEIFVDTQVRVATASTPKPVVDAVTPPTDTEIEAKIASEVDKKVRKRVQPLLATLNDLRSEVTDIIAELRQASEKQIWDIQSGRSAAW